MDDVAERLLQTFDGWSAFLTCLPSTGSLLALSCHMCVSPVRSIRYRRAGESGADLQRAQRSLLPVHAAERLRVRRQDSAGGAPAALR